jgi:hypothetical protein
VSRGSTRAALGIALLGLAAGCQRSPQGGREGPWLEAKWTGSDTGAISGPATAEWCDSLHFLEVRALRGDTGLGLAIHPRDQLEAGVYPVRASARGDSAAPAAAVAIRWFAETAIRGFQADSGSVVVEEPDTGVYSGSFEANAHSVTDARKLV